MRHAANLYFFHSWIEETTGIRAVPEPAMTALSAVAVLLLLRRRERRRVVA